LQKSEDEVDTNLTIQESAPSYSFGKELKETNAKKLEKTTEIDLLTTRIDQQSAKSARLKEEVAVLQSELSKLAKAQADMDKLRREQKETYTATRAEQMKGLEGVKLAMKLLRDYYASDAAHNAASGAGGGIIGLLETIESDMTKTIASLEEALKTLREEIAALEAKLAAFEKQFGISWEAALAAGIVFNAVDGCKKLGIDGATMDKRWAEAKKAGDLLKFGGGFYAGKIPMPKEKSSSGWLSAVVYSIASLFGGK